MARVLGHERGRGDGEGYMGTDQEEAPSETLGELTSIGGMEGVHRYVRGSNIGCPKTESQTSNAVSQLYPLRPTQLGVRRTEVTARQPAETPKHASAPQKTLLDDRSGLARIESQD